METKKMIKSWSLRIMLLTVLLSGLSLNKAYSLVVRDEVDMRGEWEINSTSRSVSLIPITASNDEYNLYIENNAPDCDMVITLVDYNTGKAVTEQFVPEVQTASITISIENLPSGTYMLKLRGQGGNKELYGIFSK